MESAPPATPPLHVGCQGVFGLRRSFAQDLLRIAPERLCVLAHDVGGSFGRRPRPIPNTSRSCTRRALGRPVKW
jgi:aerobic carbon-monoxide dehydrogenase large subunit